VPQLRYPFQSDALDAAKQAFADEGDMEAAIRAWLKEEGFGLESDADNGTMRLVGPWLDT
jgi:hypothetical protein